MTRIALIRALTSLVFLIAVTPVSARPAPRTVEPRLSGDWEWRVCRPKNPSAQELVQELRCGEANLSGRRVSDSNRVCEDVSTQSQAVMAIAAQAPCIDAAIATLKRLADNRQPGAAAAASDLAAGYIVRAQRRKRYVDYVRALAASDHAVELAPRARGGLFNQALALEALGFDDEATASWRYLQSADVSGWLGEAKAHLTRLTSRRDVQLATKWAPSRLPELAQANDTKGIGKLIAPYPFAALEMLNADVLAKWARARSKGRKVEATQQLHLAHMMAAALAHHTHDRHALDAVEQIESASTSKRTLAAIETGVLAYAAEKYPEAEAAFAAARSPLGATTAIEHARHLGAKPDEAIRLLARVETYVRQQGYPYLLALVHIRRGHPRLLQSRYLDSLAEYDAAERICAPIDDEQSLGILYARKIGILRTIGHYELAWRAAFRARRYEARVEDPSQRHVLLGEIALSALAVDCPEVALRYQSAAIQLLQDQLGVSGVDAANVHRWRGLLGMAFGWRAAIRHRLGDAKASEDLAQAIRLVSDDTLDEQHRNARMAILQDVQGQLLLRSNPSSAAKAFTDAYALALPAYPRSYTASLLVERAEAHLLQGRRADAENDLQNAVSEWRGEDRIMLAERKKGEAEPLLSPFFSRSRAAYAQLIEQYMAEGEWQRAFAASEQFRGYELLNLVQAWTQNSEPLDLPAIRRALGPSTFLLEYFVGEKQTHAWVIGPEESDFAPFTFPVGSGQIAAWTSSLAQAAVDRHDEAFLSTMEQVSAALFRRPLAHVAQVAAKRKIAPRVIFIPDGPTHGTPFAALLVTAGKQRDYLINHYPVAVAPSATLYAFSRERDAMIARPKRPSVLLIDDPTFDRTIEVAADLPSLVSADAEIEEIEQIYGGVAKLLPLAHENATVPNFFRLVPQSSIIHFAGHAVAIPDAPSESLLLFAAVKDGHNGVLTAQELLARLQSNQARLFVMAACSTAGGTPIGAEGLAPLVRPILAAGVPAAVGSLWDIPEYAAKALFAFFHQHYRQGYDADVALQLAQQDMLRGQQLTKSPAVWGSFQMTGFASSPFDNRKERK